MTLDQIPDAAFVLDAQGHIRATNGRAARLCGYPPDALINQSLAGLLVPDSARALTARLGAMSLGTADFPLLELGFSRADGEACWLEASIARLDQAHLTGWLIIAREPSKNRRNTTERSTFEFRTVQYQAVLLKLAKAPFRGLEAALHRITEAASHTLQVRRVSVWFFNEARSAIVCRDLYDQATRHHEHGQMLTVEHYPRYFQALEHSRIVAAHDALTDPNTVEFKRDYLTEFDITSMLDAPIRHQGKTIGVVCHEHVGTPRTWRLDEQYFAASIADLVILAHESAARQQAEAELRKAHDALEERVHERTAELSRVNATLRQEIAERTRIEAALRESEQRLTTLVEYAPDAIMILDADAGHLVHTNEKAVHLFGFTREVLLKMSPIDFSPERQPNGRLSREFGKEKIQEALDGGSPTFEWVHLNAAGEPVWCEVHLVRLPSASRRLIRGNITDITERKRAEEALHRGNAILKAQQEAAIDGILVIDEHQRVVSYNQRFAELWRIPADLMQLHDDRKLLNYVLSQLKDPRQFLAKVDHLYQHPSETSREEIAFNDGRVFDRYSAPVSSPARNYYGRIWYFRDIADHKRAEEELRRAKEAAEAANRAKSEFLANMSHELRTPLNSVLGYAQILRSQDALSAKQQKALGIIEQAGEHLLGLINEVLDLAKVEAGTLELHPAPFRLPRLLQGVVDAIGTRAQQKGLAFSHEWVTQLPEVVRADERRLRQVLMNLLDNAIKYTPHGGVTLKVGYQGASVRFLVEDTGIGIRPEHLSEIFNIFHQVRDGKAFEEGTGLGLAISKRLVTLMGGKLEVASTPAEGSRFWFDLVLPEEAGAMEGPPPARTLVGVKGARRRILIADDREDNRGGLRDMLLPLGFEVQETSDGRACLERACALKPDALLVDLRMPVLDGEEVIARVRATAGLEGMLIIAISASAFEHNREQCLEAGADDFLPKPFRLEKLLSLLCQHLGLELVYAPAAPVQAAPPAKPTPVVLPHPQWQALVELARRGDIRALREHAHRLAQGDVHYAAFAEELHTLAERFQLKRIRQLLNSTQHAP